MTMTLIAKKSGVTLAIAILAIGLMTFTPLISNVFAAKNTTPIIIPVSPEQSELWSEENAQQLNSPQPLSTFTFFTQTPACTHVASITNKCLGWNTSPFPSNFYYTTPYSGVVVHHNCGGYDCVDTNIRLKNSSTIAYNGKTWTFYSANSISCTTTTPQICSNPVYWGAPANDVIRSVLNAPSNTPIQHQTQYLYKSGTDQLYITSVNYLQYGYN